MPVLPDVSKRARKSLTANTWAPVSYTSEVSGLTAGTTLVLPQVSLQSGFNTPYLVDEIRMTAFTEPYDGVTAATTSDIAALLSFQFWTGSYYFSQSLTGAQPSAVPMWLFCPTYSSSACREHVYSADRWMSVRRWVFPKPLYMSPGDIVQATVLRDSTIGTIVPDITARVTIVGRALPPGTPGPAVRQVPAVAWFKHPAGQAYSEATIELQNPFKTDWHVQRLIMQSYASDDAGGFNTGRGFFVNTTTGYGLVRISDSLGYKVTGSSQGGFIPLGDVASPYTNCAWTFNREIAPDANFNVAFQIIPGSFTANLSPLISFVGYRNE